MPLQNRVTPFGQLEAAPAKGTWLGNRGILHNGDKQIVAPWRHKAWVTCRLDFPGRQRDVFSPGNYSELFFLDEATAFSAGHRPCAECRRDRYNEFKAAWLAAHSSSTDTLPSASEMDRQLHAQRAIRGGGKVSHEDPLQNLPPGAFVDIDGTPHLFWRERLYPWSHHGYGPPHPPLAQSARLKVLTPASVVAMFRIGFRPQVHASAYN